MSFTFTNYAAIDPQASPWQDALGKLLGGYQDITKAHYLKPSLEEELKKARLFNQYYGPNIESQIGLRKAQTGEAGARTGLLGEQTKGAHLENQYLPQWKEGQIAQAQANAQKSRLLQMIREQLLVGGQPNAMTNGNNINPPQIPNFQGQGLFRNEPSQQQIQLLQQKYLQQPPSQSSGSQGFNNLTYPQISVLSQLLGIGQPKIIDNNGRQIATSPLGNVDIGIQGLTEEQKAFQSGLGKYSAKLYGDSIDSYKALQNQGSAIDNLIDLTENNPQFREITGKIQKPLTNWFGSPEQKQLLGQLQSSSGEIALQVAPSLKGAFTGRDQALINEIKASPNDFPDVFIGKLKAQKLMNSALSERSKLTAQYIEQGFKPLEAEKRAAKETPLERYRDEINKLLTPNPLKRLSTDELLKLRSKAK